MNCSQLLLLLAVTAVRLFSESGPGVASADLTKEIRRPEEVLTAAEKNRDIVIALMTDHQTLQVKGKRLDQKGRGPLTFGPCSTGIGNVSTAIPMCRSRRVGRQSAHGRENSCSFALNRALVTRAGCGLSRTYTAQLRSGCFEVRHASACEHRATIKSFARHQAAFSYSGLASIS
jgi:hypothetical protein